MSALDVFFRKALMHSKQNGNLALSPTQLEALAADLAEALGEVFDDPAVDAADALELIRTDREACWRLSGVMARRMTRATYGENPDFGQAWNGLQTLIRILQPGPTRDALWAAVLRHSVARRVLNGIAPEGLA